MKITPSKTPNWTVWEGFLSGLKTILAKIANKTTFWPSFFTFAGVKNGPFCQIFSGITIALMASKITNLTAIWPSFFSGPDVKNGLS